MKNIIKIISGKNTNKNERGIGLLWAYLTTGVLLVVSTGFYGMSSWQARLTSVEISREKAFYLAEAAADQKLRELRTGNTADISSTSLDGGSFSAAYNSANKMITATGTYSGASRTVLVKTAKGTPPGVRGAMTGNGNFSTNGSINIDGRDHDLEGNVIGPGTFGISATGTFSQGGSSSVGGNGVAPADPAPAGTVEEGAPAMATTPEALLGLEPGSLDAYKTTTLPTLPMTNQIVYLTSNAGSTLWNAPNFGDEDNPSSGILIFHNSASTAEMKNLHGRFNGIIITDKLTHINGDAVINGAVIVMAADGTVGNGSADVNYSSVAIENTPLGLYTIVSWEDQLNTAIQYS